MTAHYLFHRFMEVDVNVMEIDEMEKWLEMDENIMRIDVNAKLIIYVVLGHKVRN